MLSDGTNPEGVDPVPVPAWSTKADLIDVTLLGGFGSAGYNKIRAYLLIYKVPFKELSSPPGKVPNSVYQKVPVIRVAGRQINDSAIILKYLVPVLTGTTDFNREWEDKITYQLKPNIERIMAIEAGSDMKKFVHHPVTGFGLPAPLWCMTRHLVRKKVGEMWAKNNKNLPDKFLRVDDVSQIAKAFRAEIGNKPFFHGDAPGQVDISFFGNCAVYVNAKISLVSSMIADAKLGEWWSRMEQHLRVCDLFNKDFRG